MFVVAPKRLFWWPVTVKIPSPDTAGEFQEHTFDMQFEAMPLDRARKIDEERSSLPDAEQRNRSYDYILEMARGWRDVVDADGEAVPFSREGLEAQLNFPWFSSAVLAAYQQAVLGQAPRLGN